MVNKAFDAKEKYNELKNKITKIKNEKDKLIFIKDSLSKYHSIAKESVINDINEIIEICEKKSISDYELKDIHLLLKEQDLVEKINIVKDSKIFNSLYNSGKERVQKERFENAYKKLSNFILNDNFDIPDFGEFMKETNKKDEINDELKQLFEKIGKNSIPKDKINENEIKAKALYFNCKIYEEHINSIFDFFSYFHNDDKEWDDYLCIKYKNISNKEQKVALLKELKEKNIYNYENVENHIKFFNYLYQKKQAYDFLLNNKTEDINLLYNKIEPNNRTITCKEIADTIDCVGLFQEIKKLNNNFDIFNYIKENINDENLKKFKSFTDNFVSIIELNQNFDFSINLYDEVKDIVTKADFVFEQNTEKFIYYVSNVIEKEEEVKITSIEHLKYLKNKIHIKPKLESMTQNDNMNEVNTESYNRKYELLLFFKKIVNNIEIINDYMKVLRIKGSSLPILINIIIEYPNTKYYLKNEETTFDKIKNFLFDAKNNFINQLDNFYKNDINIRFIFSRIIDSILNHLTTSLNIDPFLRYILNITDDNIDIKEGLKSNPRSTEDYVREYNLYNKESLKNISDFIGSIFINNNSSLDKHYERIKIRTEKHYKGIYIFPSSPDPVHGLLNSLNLDSQEIEYTLDILKCLLQYILRAHAFHQTDFHDNYTFI